MKLKTFYIAVILIMAALCLSSFLATAFAETIYVCKGFVGPNCDKPSLQDTFPNAEDGVLAVAEGGSGPTTDITKGTIWMQFGPLPDIALIGTCANNNFDLDIKTKCQGNLTRKNFLQLKPAVADTVPPPAPPVTRQAPPCWFKQVLGSGTIALVDTVSPRGGDFLTNQSVVVWECSDGFSYSGFAVAGNISDKFAEVSAAYANALFGDRSGLDDLAKKISRSLTPQESAVAADLFAKLPAPTLWWVKPTGTTIVYNAITYEYRSVYRLTDGKLSSASIGKVTVKMGDAKLPTAPRACLCNVRFQNSSSTYCGISTAGEVWNLVDGKPFGADAVTICTNK